MRFRRARCPTLLLLGLCPLIAAAAEPAALLLWPDGAPGSEAGAAPEQLRLSPLGEHIVSGVQRPSITPYLPAPGHASGAAVIVIPGGGHRELWMDHEGYRVARWLSARGIAAVVLKYRLALAPGSTYTVERDELADVQRAIRLLRSRAAQWQIDPDRIGVIGFSAGGELAALAGTRPAAGAADALDPIERASAAADFMALIYPAIPQHLALSAATPPAFLLCGEMDAAAIAEGVPKLYQSLKAAGASAELHVLAGAGHGFGIRAGNPANVASWPTLFYDWLEARGLLSAAHSGVAADADAAATPISPQMRAGIPGAQAIAASTPDQLALAAQSMLHRSSAPQLTNAGALTPDRPSSAGGAQLSFWKLSFVIGNASGGEAGINFWHHYDDGHVNVGFSAAAGAATLLDCRLLSSAAIRYRIYAGEATTPSSQGRSSPTRGHLLLLVPGAAQDGALSVELWPSPPHARVGFFGCDLWRVD